MEKKRDILGEYWTDGVHTLRFFRELGMWVKVKN